MTYRLLVNGKERMVDAQPGTPLLWALREHLGLMGTKFGCGEGYCGACMVLIDGQRAFSCLIPIDALGKVEVTTIEGLEGPIGSSLKRAWIAEAVPQCGYCQSGMIVCAASLLSESRRPSRDEIREYMSTNICRCGTYGRVVRAVERAAAEIGHAADD